MQHQHWLRRFWNGWITCLLWVYFLIAFVIRFAPQVLWIMLLQRQNAALALQHLNHRFCQSFFRVVQGLIPSVEIILPPMVRALRATIVVSNHQSYLDPLLLITAFPAHKTIVRADLFRLPIFGGFISRMGYLPSAFEPHQLEQLEQQLQNLDAFFQQGGNLFIFPEGTRSRDGRLGAFHKSAFQLARRFQRPIALLRLHHTEQLYPPGHFCFNTAPAAPLQVELLDVIPSTGQTTRQLQLQAWERLQAAISYHHAENTDGPSGNHPDCG